MSDKEITVKDEKSNKKKESAPKQIKTNADRYEKWEFKPMPRVQLEETEEKARLVHSERGKKESATYYNTRKLAHDFTGKEFRTPQFNQDLIVKFLNSKLPKERQIVEASFVVRGLDNLRFFPANLKADDYIAVNVHQPADPKKVLGLFGIK